MSFVKPFMGFALGDAFGSMFEGLTRDEVDRRLRYVKRRGKVVSDVTDDTIQVLILAESLASTIHFSPQDFSERLKLAYESGKIPKIGPTTSKAVEKLKLGCSWRESGVNSNTCGSAMRVMPLALLYSFDLNLVEKYSALQSVVTHTNKEAIASSVALALTYACVFRGELEKRAGEIVERVRSYDVYTSISIEKAFEGNYEYRGTILAFDVVSFAIQCYLYSESYPDCLLNSVMAGGDTDTVAAIAGGLKAIEVEDKEVKFPLVEIKNSVKEEIVRVAEKLWRVYEFISR